MSNVTTKVLKKNAIKAYKVFNPDFTCRGFKFEVGGKYHQEGVVKLCKNGFHACIKAVDCFNYYAFNDKNIVAEVLLFGDVNSDDSNKICASDLVVVKTLTWFEVLGLVNTGYSNTGDWNTGYSNTGNRNTGNKNTGDWNTGYNNTGYNNTGDWNTGDWNTGYNNTGNSNTGNSNTGNKNTGDWNTGYNNTGNRNTGDWNTGYNNTGDWNTCDKQTGFFNTIQPDVINVFNAPCEVSRWEGADKPSFLYFDVVEWVYGSDMSDIEKEDNPSHTTTGGYLKKLSYKEAFQKSFEKASKRDVELLKALPNFDKDVFFEISGIMVD